MKVRDNDLAQDLFQDTFDITKNAEFLNIMKRGFENQNWSKIILFT